jgi:peroxiredoxin
MKYILVLVIAICCFSCSKKAFTPEEGSWRAALIIDDDHEIPFLVTYASDTTMTIINAAERIEISNVQLFGKDSIYIEHPVFEGILKGVYTENYISGEFVKPSLERIMPFYMTFGNDARFEPFSVPNLIINGSWETVFSPNADANRYIAKGDFEQTGNRITGTFRTTTGDYRYLDGILVNDSLKLSTFDGAHAFLFEAKVTDSTMVGNFYSGNHWSEPFTATLNNDYELPPTDSLTFLKEDYDTIDFTFNDTSGHPISLRDTRFRDKVVLVQIMGTWCPNCLDETAYFSEFYKRQDTANFEIVSLAFEYAKTEESALKAINKLKNRHQVDYPILLAQYGSSSKLKANEKLPMLNHVLSYPTTIFLDRNKKVRKIHTGFNGPATGIEYTNFVETFEVFVGNLLDEEKESSILDILK